MNPSSRHGLAAAFDTVASALTTPMRFPTSRSRRWVSAGVTALFVFLGSTRAQEQEEAAAQPATAAPAESAPTETVEPKIVRVLRVGTVHPVSGPAIRDGVIVIEGDRIVAVGAASEVEVPEGAEVAAFPDAHAYPGLVDALSTGFGDADVVDDGSSDAGTEILDGLDPYDEISRSLIEWGITTAYISNRGGATWRGMGTLVHPLGDGFEPMHHASAAAAAVQLRISGGNDSTHPLARQKSLRTVGNSFAELEAYEKKQKEHQEALEKYAADYEKYLAYHRSKKTGGDQADTERSGGDGEADDEQRGRRGRSGRGERGPGRRGGRGGTPPTEPPPADEKPAEKKATDEPKAETAETPKPATEAAAEDKTKKDEAPKKPEYPKPLPPSPAKDALLKVRDGSLPLRVEACQVDEIDAALRMRREREIPQMVLEVATDAGELADELATAGIPVVATGLLEPPTDPQRDSHAADLPARLAAAGVAVAIGSGSVREARYLPLMAAAACGRGLDVDTAIAAITLTPAKMLGIASQVGSLEPGKRADVLITNSPLLASDARILAVLSGGETRYQAK